MANKKVSKLVKVNKKGIKKCPYFSVLCFMLIPAIILFIFNILFVAHVFGREHSIVFGNFFITAISFLALLATIFLYFKVPKNFPLEKKGHLFMVFSLFFFFLGDLLWLISEIHFKNLVPIGGLPDLSWNVAYLFLIIAVGFFISLSFRPSKKTFFTILIMGFIVGGIILGLDIVEDLNLGSFTFAHAIQDLYILYDIILIFMIVYLITPLIGSGSKYFVSWIIIGVGILFRVIYDFIFANLSERGTYSTGDPIDLLYVLFYIFIIVSERIKFRALRCQDD